MTQKIVAGAADIAAGGQGPLKLGNLSVARDFGWAPDYVEAMAAMLRADQPTDYVIATGRTHTLEDFVAATFAWFGLDWRRHVEMDPALLRPTDIARSAGKPSKARDQLGWTAKHDMASVVAQLAEAELKRRAGRLDL